MISIVQKNKKSITTVILAGVAAVLMVSFGLDVNTGIRSGRKNLAMTVDNDSISYNAFRDQYERLSAIYRNQYPQNFAELKKFLNLEQRTIDSLQEEILLGRYSSELGLSVGQQQIEARLQKIPFFQSAGLTQETFDRFVQSQGMSHAAFENAVKKELESEQLREVITDLSQPSEKELRTAFISNNTKSEFEILPISAKFFSTKVDVSDEAKLKEYFDANSDLYRKPKTLRYSYVSFPPTEYAAKVSASDDDLKDLYARKEKSFTEPKQVHLRQIVINRPTSKKSELENLVSSGKDSNASEPDTTALDKQKKILIEDLQVKVDQGLSFADTAKTSSEDKATAEKGGDLGWQSLPAIPKEFRVAVDELEKGRVTKVLSNPEKYVIYYLEDVKEPQLKPFESVRSELETEFKGSLAPEYARVEAENFLSGFREASAGGKMTLDEYAKSKGKTALDTGALVDVTEDVTKVPGLTQKVMSTPMGESEVVRASDIDYVVFVSEVKDAYIPELAAVKEKVVLDFRTREANRLAKEAAEAALTKLKALDPSADLHQAMENIAKEYETQLKATAPLSKSTATSEDLFMNPETKKVAFALTAEHSLADKVAASSDSFAVYRLKKKTPPTEEEINNGLKAYKLTERSKVESRMFTYLLDNLKASSNIWVNPEIIKQSGPEDSFPS